MEAHGLPALPPPTTHFDCLPALPPASFRRKPPCPLPVHLPPRLPSHTPYTLTPSFTPPFTSPLPGARRSLRLTPVSRALHIYLTPPVNPPPTFTIPFQVRDSRAASLPSLGMLTRTEEEAVQRNNERRNTAVEAAERRFGQRPAA